jgi:DNA-binding FrmR family transcriptional regulator
MPAWWETSCSIIYPWGYSEATVITDMQSDVLNRLRRIEGQVRGLQRLVVEGQDCTQVVHQLAAARRALDKVGFLVLTHRMQECIEEKKLKDGSEGSKMEEAMKLFLTLA